MILTSGLLLLAVASIAEAHPFPTNNPQQASFSYAQNPFQQAMQIPLQQSQAQLYVPFTTTQEFLNQMNANTQRLFQVPQQRHHYQQQSQHQQLARFNQQQQPQRPIQTGSRAAGQQYAPAAPLSQQIVQATNEQRNFQHQGDQNRAIGAASKVAPNQEISNADFLSSLQIIDTQGRVRDLRDFGLGGTGNSPHEPELERQLRSIFDTIGRDLENAAFLPLDVNGASQHLGGIIQDAGQQQHQQQSQPQPQSQQQHQNQQYAPQQTIRQEREQIPLKEQPIQQQQVVELPATKQENQNQNQQQQLGYSFTQPKQHQFQFLRPFRGNKQPEVSEPQQPIKSPAQTLRESKQLSKSNLDDQRPIEQARENLPQLPVKGFESVRPPKAPVSPVEPPRQAYAVPEVRLEQQKVQEQPTSTTRLPLPVKGQQQIEQQQVFVAPTRPVPVAPVQQIQQSHQIQHVQQVLEQQQQQAGFDDEPTPLKPVEHDSTSHRHNKPIGQQAKGQVSSSKGFANLEQTKLDVEPQQIQQQINYDDDHRASVAKGEPAKGDGWVPIMQSIVVEQSKQPESFYQQRRPEQHSFDQRPVFQQKQEAHRIEQQQQREEPPQQQREQANFDSPQQQQEKVEAEPEFSQQVSNVGETKQEARRPVVSSPMKSRAPEVARSNQASFGRGQEQEKISQLDNEEQPEAKFVRVEQQEQRISSQGGDFVKQSEPQTTIDEVPSKQEQSFSTQREEPLPSSTRRPASSQGTKGGRKVKSVQQIRTPIQKVREAQAKMASKQQSFSSQKEQAVKKSELIVEQQQQPPVKQQQRAPAKLAPPPPLPPVQQQPQQQQQQQVKVDVNEQTDAEEPGTQSTPIAFTQQEAKPFGQSKIDNIAQVQQQAQIVQDDFSDQQQPQQRKEVNQVQQRQEEINQPIAQQENISQEKEQSQQQQQEAIQAEPEVQQQPKREQTRLQQRPIVEDEEQQQEQLKEDSPALVQVNQQRQTDNVQEQKQEQTGDEVQQFKQEQFTTAQQAFEEPVQQISTTARPTLVQRARKTSKTKMVVQKARVQEAKQVDQSFQQQTREEPVQQQQQQRTQQQQEDLTSTEEPVTTISVTTPQLPFRETFVQQQEPQQQVQQQEDQQQQRETDSVTQQQEELPTTPSQQPRQEVSQQQELQQQQQEVRQEQAKEQDQFPSQPQISQQQQQEELPAQNVEQSRPEVSQQRQEQANEEVQVKQQEQFTTVAQTEEPIPTTTQRPLVQRVVKGRRKQVSRTRGQQFQRQPEQQKISQQQYQEPTQFRDESQVQKFNMDPNTYNPLQFEPERISSLTRQAQSSLV